MTINVLTNIEEKELIYVLKSEISNKLIDDSLERTLTTTIVKELLKTLDVKMTAKVLRIVVDVTGRAVNSRRKE